MRNAVILATLVLSMSIAAQNEPAGPARRAAAANNAFTWSLYGQLAGDGNLFFSPYSVSVALAMTREGAAGRTAAQMDRVLHLPAGTFGDDFAALAAALEPKEVRDGFGDDAAMVPAYAMHVANRLFGQHDFGFLAPFETRLRTTWTAPMERIDFRDTAAARARINAWVAEQTRDRIRDIIPPNLPEPSTALALANAIYLKAAWAEPFQERETRVEPFHVAGGDSPHDVPTMHRTGTLRHAVIGDRVQLLELPYRGADLSMVVILPTATDGLAAIEDELDAKTVDDWLGRLERRRVAVALPRFEVTTPVRLDDQLKAMGMPDAFSQGADFSKMASDAERLFIGAVLHKAFVRVDEAGTEAAAATVVMMLRASHSTDEPVQFKADHPFAFLIRDRRTGCILFAGRVTDPSSSH